MLRIRYFDGEELLEIFLGETMIFSLHLTRKKSSLARRLVSVERRDKCGEEIDGNDDFESNKNRCSID